MKHNDTLTLDINDKISTLHIPNELLLMAFGRSTQISYKKPALPWLGVFDSCVASLSASSPKVVVMASKRKAFLQCPERSQALIAAQQLITFLETNTVYSCVVFFLDNISF